MTPESIVTRHYKELNRVQRAYRNYQLKHRVRLGCKLRVLKWYGNLCKTKLDLQRSAVSQWGSFT